MCSQTTNRTLPTATIALSLSPWTHWTHARRTHTNRSDNYQFIYMAIKSEYVLESHLGRAYAHVYPYPVRVMGTIRVPNNGDTIWCNQISNFKLTRAHRTNDAGRTAYFSCAQWFRVLLNGWGWVLVIVVNTGAYSFSAKPHNLCTAFDAFPFAHGWERENWRNQIDCTRCKGANRVRTFRHKMRQWFSHRI